MVKENQKSTYLLSSDGSGFIGILSMKPEPANENIFFNKINNLSWPAAAAAVAMEWATAEATWACEGGGIIVVSIFYEQ